MVMCEEELRKIADGGLERVMTLPDIKEAELFASSNDVDTTKINYTSDIPCNGVEQPSFDTSGGIGVRVVLKNGYYGVGVESSLSPEAALNAGRKAVEAAHLDPFMTLLPRPAEDNPKISNYHDQRVIDAGGEVAVDSGWRALDGAIDAYRQAGFKSVDRLLVSGDITSVREVMAIASSTGVKVSDISTVLMAYLTTMAQERNSKGTGWATGSSLDTFKPVDAGRMAAESAIRGVDGKGIDSGVYNVVFGPQAVTDLVVNFLVRGATAENIARGDSPFVGKFGQQAISELLRVYDDGSIAGLAASKAYTCEGLPTEKTVLIENGRLVGLLSTQDNAFSWSLDSIDERVIDYKKRLQGFLGTDQIPMLRGRNGFRFGRGGGRQYMGEPSANATNLFLEGTDPIPEGELVDGSRLENGIYIGRLWYTYPINGLAKADVTSTAIADSYIVKGGKIVGALRPNAVRVNDNFLGMFNRIEAVGHKNHGTIVWGAEEVVYAPHLLIREVHLDAVVEA